MQRAIPWTAFLASAVVLSGSTFGLVPPQEASLAAGELPAASVPVPGADECLECHKKETPGIAAHFERSLHARFGVTCAECHRAGAEDLDSWEHYGRLIATIVTPRDCGQCHETEYEEFEASHHAKGGNILHSLDNLLAEVVEGHRGEFEVPHPHQPGATLKVNGLAFASSGCQQCHGSQIALRTKDGGSATPWRLVRPPGGGKAVVTFDLSLVDPEVLLRSEEGQPLFDARTWPNTGIGRMNLDGSRGSCTACHSRHDFSARRARQPENCGKCHLGPDHPQKEIYEESKHGVAYRDLRAEMNLESPSWVLGEDYAAAPTCATCHMSATRNQPVTHDPRERISWSNRPPASVRLDTDASHEVVSDPSAIVSSWQDKRAKMKDVCFHCHTPNYVDGFYQQYDDFIELYNAKYARPGLELMAALKANGLISKPDFDDKIEWTWFYLWHHEGRRGRHGVSMMAPDYAHWHGTYEVADRWYNELIPEAREILEQASHDPERQAGAAAASAVLERILSAPEHRYATTGELPGGR